MQFDSKVALFVLRLIRNFAYDPFAFTPPEGLVVVAFSSSCISCVMRDNLNVWIIFRGTQTSQEIRSDLQFAQVYGVHRGFFGLFALFRSFLLSIIHPAQKVIFAGHSLGAALTTLCMNLVPCDKGVGYAFGSPRVGNPDFAERLTAKHFYNIMNTSNT